MAPTDHPRAPQEAPPALAGPVEIRRGRPGDTAALAELEAAAFDEPWSRRSLASRLADPDCLVYVARPPAGHLAAYASFLVLVEDDPELPEAAGEAELLRLATHPDARRRGLAARLLDLGLGELRRRRIALCHLEVRADNHPAHALYRRHGFVETGRRPGYYRDGTDAVVLTAELFAPRDDRNA